MFHGLRQTYLVLARQGKANEAEMVMSFLIAVAGYLIAAVFLHSAYPRYFWLLFGIALAIAHIGKTAKLGHELPDEQRGEPLQDAACLTYDR